MEWISELLDADVTISGAVTGNIWAAETNMSANVAINFVVDVIDGATGAITQIVKSARITELGTARAVNNFTATPGAGVACKRGDRLRVRIFGDDAGTMATGFFFDASYNGSSAGADGDTYITFTETFAFDTSTPSASQLFLTAVVSPVSVGTDEREAWTSRGGASANAVTDTVSGWTSPVQITVASAQSVIEWYTKQLQAFTLAGKCRFSIRAKQSDVSANVSLMAEIAVVDSNGANPVVAGIAHADATNFGELSAASTTAVVADVGVEDIAVAEGQRLRFRIYIDDLANVALAAGSTATVTYNGAFSNADGDTFVLLPQAVAELVAAAPGPSFPIRHTARRALQRR